jgi:hypothetical protein
MLHRAELNDGLMTLGRMGTGFSNGTKLDDPFLYGRYQEH